METLAIVLLLIIGTGLLVLEFFVPGFGLPGISGIVLLAAGVTVTFTHYGAVAGLISLVGTLALCIACIVVSVRSASKGRLSHSALILKNEAKEGLEETVTLAEGTTGCAITPLRPAGIAELDGKRLNVVSEGEFIEKGAALRVTKVEGSRIQVARN